MGDFFFLKNVFFRQNIKIICFCCVLYGFYLSLQPINQFKLKEMKVSVLEMNKKYYIPVKYIFESNKLDFNNSMLYFNSFKFDIERVYLEHENIEYMCFTVSDFIRFVLIVSVLDKKLDKYAQSLIDKLEKNNFKVINKTTEDLMKIIEKYVRKPEPEEKADFIMVKNLIPKMKKEDISLFENNQIIGRILKANYKRVAKRIGRDVRYGYEVILIS